MYRNIPVLDNGSRGATNTFAQREIGDVLIAWESEAHLALNQLRKGKIEIIIPSVSILAEPLVSVVDRVVDRRGTRAVAEEYLSYLCSKEVQRIVAKHYYRPLDSEVVREFGGRFPSLKLHTIDEIFGGWDVAQEAHFNDGGEFDRIFASRC